MRIRNGNYEAGTSIQLPFERDASGLKARAVAAAGGVFDVPQKDGEWLCATSGFRPVRAARELPPVAPQDPAESPEPASPAEGPPEPEEAEEEAAEAEEEAPPEDPDVDGLRTKAEALALAEEYGVELDPDMLLRDMKAALEAAIYGEG